MPLLPIQSQMGDLKCVDTAELGAVIDMIKDLAKAIYYCEVYEQMEEAQQARKNEVPFRSAASEVHNSGWHSSESEWKEGTSYGGHHAEGSNQLHLRDEREGRSPMKRKRYIESKTSGADMSKSIKELENYMQDLTSDIMEMLDKASPEEKAMAQKKISTLAAKVQNV